MLRMKPILPLWAWQLPRSSLHPNPVSALPSLLIFSNRTEQAYTVCVTGLTLLSVLIPPNAQRVRSPPRKQFTTRLEHSYPTNQSQRRSHLLSGTET